MPAKMDINLTGATFTDELHADVGASAFEIDHDFFTQSDLVIRTAAAGGGTLLVEGVGDDYTLSEEDTFLSGATSETVYRLITIVNVTYQTGDLYFSGKYIADANEAEDINDLIMIVEDVKAFSAAGGTFTSGADQTRDLNTVQHNTIDGASLAVNQITLPAGTYEVDWSCPAFDVNNHFSWIYDTTGSAILLQGQASYTVNTTNVTTHSLGMGVFTITEESVLEVRHRCAVTSGNVNGFGVNTSISGFDSVYSQIRIKKLNA